MSVCVRGCVFFWLCVCLFVCVCACVCVCVCECVSLYMCVFEHFHRAFKKLFRRGTECAKKMIRLQYKDSQKTLSEESYKSENSQTLLIIADDTGNRK